MKNSFIKYCKVHNLDLNINQLKCIDILETFKNNILKKNFFLNLFNKEKLGFYLFGDVGVGKTMILNFFFDQISLKKKKIHFNKFMIEFHNFRHLNKNKFEISYINSYVSNLKKNFDIIYLDEFQVTNIVDAMLLGKLFQIIFIKKINVIFTSNIKIENLYKDGLQRSQFLPFINILKQNCIEHELSIEYDYRKLPLAKLERFFYPLNDHSTFQINHFFRKLTKNKIKKTKLLYIKGREIMIENYYEGIIKFHFDQLCSLNLGSEDYLCIANISKLIIIEEIPIFNDDNADKQNRFITLIDILYEKQIPLMVSSNFNLDNFESSKKLDSVFKRTVSRLFELTSPKFSIN